MKSFPLRAVFKLAFSTRKTPSIRSPLLLESSVCWFKGCPLSLSNGHSAPKKRNFQVEFHCEVESYLIRMFLQPLTGLAGSIGWGRIRGQVSYQNTSTGGLLEF